VHARKTSRLNKKGVYPRLATRLRPRAGRSRARGLRLYKPRPCRRRVSRRCGNARLSGRSLRDALPPVVSSYGRNGSPSTNGASGRSMSNPKCLPLCRGSCRCGEKTPGCVGNPYLTGLGKNCPSSGPMGRSSDGIARNIRRFSQLPSLLPLPRPSRLSL
jgi:hypothetical protein